MTKNYNAHEREIMQGIITGCKGSEECVKAVCGDNQQEKNKLLIAQIEKLKSEKTQCEDDLRDLSQDFKNQQNSTMLLKTSAEENPLYKNITLLENENHLLKIKLNLCKNITHLHPIDHTNDDSLFETLNKKLEKKLETCENSAKKLNSNVEKLTNELAQCNDEKEKLKSHITTNNKHIDFSTDQFFHINGTMHHYAAQLKNMTNIVKSSTSIVNKLQEEKQLYLVEKDKLQDELKKCNSHDDQRVDLCKTLTDQLRREKYDCLDKKTKLETKLEGYNIDQEKQVELCKTLTDQLRREKNNCFNEKDKLQDELKKCNSHDDQGVDLCKTLTDQLRREKNNCFNEKDKLQDELKKCNSHDDQRVDLCKTLTDQLRREKNNCFNEKDKLQDELKDCDQQVNLAASYYMYAIEQLNQAKQENNLFRSDLADCLNSKKGLQDDIKILQNFNQTSGIEIQKLKSDNMNLVQVNHRLETMIKSLNNNKTEFTECQKTHNYIDEIFGVCKNAKCESFYASKIIKLVSALKIFVPKEHSTNQVIEKSEDLLSVSHEIYNELKDISQLGVDFFSAATDALIPDFIQ